jgi:hypothetical protein
MLQQRVPFHYIGLVSTMCSSRRSRVLLVRNSAFEVQLQSHVNRRTIRNQGRRRQGRGRGHDLDELESRFTPLLEVAQIWTSQTVPPHPCIYSSKERSTSLQILSLTRYWSHSLDKPQGTTTTQELDEHNDQPSSTGVRTCSRRLTSAFLFSLL